MLFDDSQASLLQTGGHKKKQSTSYKRPGPPTPSKLGGRLSIGGSSDVNYLNILKESNNAETATKKTPNRFKNIFSSSSKKDAEVSSSFVINFLVEWCLVVL